MVSNTAKEAKDIRAEVLNSVVVWLVTAVEIETLAGKIYLQQLDGHKCVYKFSKPIDQEGQQAKDITYYVGKYGDCPAVISEISLDLNAHASNIVKMTRELFPNINGVISVGVAADIENEVNMYDVLVSSEVIGENLPNVETIPVSQQIRNVFEQSVEWPNKLIQEHFKHQKLQLVPNVKLGTILSLPQHSKAIGNKLGIGFDLFAKIELTMKHIILVKSVCDSGDGRKSNLYQPTAALLAADLVHKCCSTSLALNTFSGINNLTTYICMYTHVIMILE